jgi:hypothetical protein
MKSEIEKLSALVERQRQTIARLSAPGIERAPWFYAPCSNCGAIEGMGLTTPEIDGARKPGYSSLWCIRVFWCWSSC